MVSIIPVRCFCSNNRPQGVICEPVHYHDAKKHHCFFHKSDLFRRIAAILPNIIRCCYFWKKKSAACPKPHVKCWALIHPIFQARQLSQSYGDITFLSPIDVGKRFVPYPQIFSNIFNASEQEIWLTKQNFKYPLFFSFFHRESYLEITQNTYFFNCLYSSNNLVS